MRRPRQPSGSVRLDTFAGLFLFDVTIVLKAGSARVSFSWTSKTARPSFLPVRVGCQHGGPVLGQSLCALPQPQCTGCFCRHMQTWTIAPQSETSRVPKPQTPRPKPQNPNRKSQTLILEVKSNGAKDRAPIKPPDLGKEGPRTSGKGFKPILWHFQSDPPKRQRSTRGLRA